MFRVREMGCKDREFETAQMVFDYLATLRKTHISVLRTLPDGLKRVFFLSIDSLGTIRKSYGSEELVDVGYIQP